MSRTMISLRTASERLGVSQLTLRNAIARGDLTAYRIGTSRCIRLDINDVDALFQPVAPDDPLITVGVH